MGAVPQYTLDNSFMVRVLISGAGGFLGRRLTKALVEDGTVHYEERRERISHITLADRFPLEAGVASQIAIESLQGDLADAEFVEMLSAKNFDSIFHLAAGLTLDAERETRKLIVANGHPSSRILLPEGTKCRVR
jgi:nucleoside-diphosphate-sugar epimerase